VSCDYVTKYVCDFETRPFLLFHPYLAAGAGFLSLGPPVNRTRPEQVFVVRSCLLTSYILSSTCNCTWPYVRSLPRCPPRPARSERRRYCYGRVPRPRHAQRHSPPPRPTLSCVHKEEERQRNGWPVPRVVNLLQGISNWYSARFTTYNLAGKSGSKLGSPVFSRKNAHLHRKWRAGEEREKNHHCTNIILSSPHLSTQKNMPLNI